MTLLKEENIMRITALIAASAALALAACQPAAKTEEAPAAEAPATEAAH